MNKDLRQFLELVKRAGPDYYIETNRPLNPELEVDILQLKLYREKRSPVIFCPKIKGSKLPLVSNLFGSYELLGLALGLDPITATRSQILCEFMKRETQTKPVKVIPASEAPIKEKIQIGKDVDLRILPVTKHAELDSGRYITIGQTICKDPDNGRLNCGVYRQEVKDKDHLSSLFIQGHHAADIVHRYAELDRPMEVVIFIGHHPAAAFGSLAGGRNMDELEVIGGFMGEPLEVAKAETVDLPVPAYAEIAIEGTIDPRNLVSDGPFAEWVGYYGLPAKCHLINVSCITMRHDAIYHDLAASQKEHVMAGALGRTSMVFRNIKRIVPSVKDVNLPYSGRANMIGYIALGSHVHGDAKKAALAAIKSIDTLRLAVVVDEDIDIHDEEQVLWAIATRTTPDKDVEIMPGMPGCSLNPTSYNENHTGRGTKNSKMVIDATKPVGQSFPVVVAPQMD